MYGVISASRCRIPDVYALLSGFTSFMWLTLHEGGFSMWQHGQEPVTIDEALEFIGSVMWRGSKPGLERTTELLERIGNPHHRFKSVHITGTNGKGSTAAMLASVLMAAGHRTGLFTSPHLHSLGERIQVNGRPVTDEGIVRATAELSPYALAMEDRPTEFELMTAIAFSCFAHEACDIVVVEVGMGGRLDSTNVVIPECSVITSIGLDHTSELGGTIELITREKAGIIKPGRPVVLYGQDNGAVNVIGEICRERGCMLTVSDNSEIIAVSDDIDGQRFSYRGGSELYIPLLGAHQLKNAAVALDVVRVLRRRGWEISYEAVFSGLAEVKWPARFEIISRSPYFIVDGGHNPQCCEAVRDGLKRYFPGKRAVMLFGVFADKNYIEMLDILDTAALAYIATQPAGERALPAEELGEELERYGRPVTVCADAGEAVREAIRQAGEDGLVCSVGSLYLAADVRVEFGFGEE